MKSTTPSLAWVAKNYSLLKGRLARYAERKAKLEIQLEAHRHGVESSVRRIVLLENAITRTTTLIRESGVVISMHETPLETSHIATVRPHEFGSILPKGGFTRVIHQTIRKGKGSATTDEIAKAVMVAAKKPDAAYKYVRKRVLIRLCILARTGRVISDLSPARTRKRAWSLPRRSDESLSSRQF